MDLKLNFNLKDGVIENKINKNIENKINIESLFWKCWRNKYIRNKIISEFQSFYNFKVEISIDNLNLYRNCSFIKKLELHHKDKNIEGLIPDTVEELELVSNFKKTELNDKCIPLSVKKLKFSSGYKKYIKAKDIPSSVEILELSDKFNQFLVPGLFPDSITSLKFGHGFHKSLRGPKLNNNGGIINFPETPLPTNLTYLEFGDSFNHSINSNQLPKTLKTIKFGNGFTQDLGFLLNHSIEFIRIPNYLNSLNQLKTIKKLEFGKAFNSILNRSLLPPLLEKLYLDSTIFNQTLYEDSIPQHLLKIKFSSVFNLPIQKNVFPSTIKTIIFGEDFNQPIQKDTIPLYCEKLIFGDNFNQLIESGSLPSTLKTIHFGNGFKMDLKNVIPDSVKDLKNFPVTSSQYIPRNVQKLTFEEIEYGYSDLPNSITDLDLGYSIQDEYIPKNVKNLKVFGFNRYTKALPNNLERLTVSGYFSSFPNNFIPDTLYYLRLGFATNIKSDIIPKFLKVLILDNPEEILKLNFLKDSSIKYLEIGPEPPCRSLDRKWRKDIKTRYKIEKLYVSNSDLPKNLECLVINYNIQRFFDLDSFRNNNWDFIKTSLNKWIFKKKIF